MEKNTLVLLVLGVLIVVAVVQAVQFSGLAQKIGGGAVAVVAPQSAGSGQQAKLPSNLDNLPSMVGGC